MPILAGETAAPFVPQDRSLPVLMQATQQCRGCDPYLTATQAVFGEVENGSTVEPLQISIMMIGEQPGDSEDKAGRSVALLESYSTRLLPKPESIAKRSTSRIL